MSGRTSLAVLRGAAIAALLSVLLGGCAYDYLQHTDRVAFSTGDAVKANLEAQTTNPSKQSMSDTEGLGKNGVVVPPPADGGDAPATD